MVRIEQPNPWPFCYQEVEVVQGIHNRPTAAFDYSGGNNHISQNTPQAPPPLGVGKGDLRGRPRQSDMDGWILNKHWLVMRAYNIYPILCCCLFSYQLSSARKGWTPDSLVPTSPCVPPLFSPWPRHTRTGALFPFTYICCGVDEAKRW